MGLVVFVSFLFFASLGGAPNKPPPIKCPSANISRRSLTHSQPIEAASKFGMLNINPDLSDSGLLLLHLAFSGQHS